MTDKVESDYDGFRENGPHRLTNLNAWPVAGGTVLERIGYVSLVLGFEVSKAHVMLSFSASNLLIRI